MKQPDELRAIFEGAGIDLTRPIVTSCGSGITACVLTLALNRIGHSRNAVYDGSWVEWGAYEDLEVATGPRRWLKFCGPGTTSSTSSPTWRWTKGPGRPRLCVLRILTLHFCKRNRRQLDIFCIFIGQSARNTSGPTD